MTRASAIPAAQLIPAAAVPAIRKRSTSRFIPAPASRPFAIPAASGEAGAYQNRSARPASHPLMHGACRWGVSHGGTDARRTPNAQEPPDLAAGGSVRMECAPTGSDRDRALVRVAAAGHEGVELLAVLGALQLLDEGRELLGLVVEAAALRFQPLQLAPAIIVEGGVAGAREAKRRGRAAQAREGAGKVLSVESLE